MALGGAIVSHPRRVRGLILLRAFILGSLCITATMCSAKGEAIGIIFFENWQDALSVQRCEVENDSTMPRQVVGDATIASHGRRVGALPR